MKRIAQAPNLMLATLWADMLQAEGFDVMLQRTYAAGATGELPPDQALPEIWVHDDAQAPAAERALQALRHPPVRHWRCAACGEAIDGPFEQCWRCGAMRPG